MVAVAVGLVCIQNIKTEREGERERESKHKRNNVLLEPNGLGLSVQT